MSTDPEDRSEERPALETSRREEVVAQVDEAGRRLSTAMVLFHTVLADHLGLGPSDWKTTDLLERFGPLTAGELVRRSGLAPASVTGVVDRLERHGYVHRKKDERDRRRVVVELDYAAMAGLGDAFSGLLDRMAGVYAQYSEAELHMIRDFLLAAAQRQHEATAELNISAGQ